MRPEENKFQRRQVHLVQKSRLSGGGTSRRFAQLGRTATAAPERIQGARHFESSQRRVLRNDVLNYLDTDFFGFVISFSERHYLTRAAGSELAPFPLADSGQTLSPSGPPLGLSFWAPRPNLAVRMRLQGHLIPRPVRQAPSTHGRACPFFDSCLPLNPNSAEHDREQQR